jgi:UDP-N-acetylmuramyl pentapeptide phosphotransferase/UDP-N-acetylglucosamine-1-phosphate transferase
MLTLTATCARVGGVEMHHRLQQSDFNVAIGSITMAVLLGLVDDLVDLKWREKLVVGAVMALPLVGSYSGPTSVILPKQLRFCKCHIYSVFSFSVGLFLHTTVLQRLNTYTHLFDCNYHLLCLFSSFFFLLSSFFFFHLFQR